MAANRTTPSSSAAVDAFIAGLGDERRIADSRALVDIMRRITGSVERLDRLGTHALGKGCVYVNKLADIDLAALEDLLRHAYSCRT